METVRVPSGVLVQLWHWLVKVNNGPNTIRLFRCCPDVDR